MPSSPTHRRTHRLSEKLGQRGERVDERVDEYSDELAATTETAWRQQGSNLRRRRSTRLKPRRALTY